jgi:hypothetical protein
LRSSRALALIVATVALASLSLSAAENPDLRGSWILNRDLSDDPQRAYEKWQGSLRNRGDTDGLSNEGAAGHRVGGGVSGPRREGGKEAGPSAEAHGGAAGANAGQGLAGARGVLGMMQAFSQGSQRLTLSQADPEFVIESSNGDETLVFTDGREMVREEERGGKTRVKTRWKKGRLVVKVMFPSSSGATPILSQTYSLSKVGHLQVSNTVGLGDGRRPFTVNRVYDRQEQ